MRALFSPQEPTFLNSSSTSNQVAEEPLSRCAASELLFIYLKMKDHHFTFLSSLRSTCCSCECVGFFMTQFPVP